MRLSKKDASGLSFYVVAALFWDLPDRFGCEVNVTVNTVLILSVTSHNNCQKNLRITKDTQFLGNVQPGVYSGVFAGHYC